MQVTSLEITSIINPADFRLQPLHMCPVVEIESQGKFDIPPICVIITNKSKK